MRSISKVIVPLGIVASSFATPVFAESKGFYFKGNVGVTDISDVTATVSSVSATLEIDSGVSYGVGVGYDFGNDFRTEIGYDIITGDISKIAGTSASADIDASTISLSIFKDFSSDSKFTPYVGVGVGSTNVDIGTLSISGTSYAGTDDSATSAALTLGTSYELNDSSAFFVEGNYRKVGDLTITGVEYSDISSLGANAGFKFTF